MLDTAWEIGLLPRAMNIDRQWQAPMSLPVCNESIASAYSYCDRITSIHSKSFYAASALLPRNKRRAIRALYAFCRTTDDIIDIKGKEGERELELWREWSLGPSPRTNDPISIAWADARKTFNVPEVYAHQLLDGVAKDIHVNRYNTFSELTEYCYSVASTVGLMSMYIIGFDKSEEAVRQAIKLGVALQLTNILRDIREDWQRGRIYLPQDELKAAGIDNRYFQEGINDERWRTFMRFQVERNRGIYLDSLSGINLLNPQGRLAIAAAATFYMGILDKIEEKKYNIFSSRARLSKMDKLKKVPALWFRYGSPSYILK
jgi:phytoene synthase